IRPAKVARDIGFHAGKYDGLLSVQSFEKIDAVRQLNRFVRPLLAIVLTKPPFEYDKGTKSREVALIVYPEQKLTEVHFEVCSDGVLEWMTWKDGNVVSRQVQVSGIQMDKDMNISFDRVSLPPPEELRSSVLSPLKAYDGLHTLRLGNVTARGRALPGTIDATKLETFSLQL
ncbi:unnamed protein product, partial [marine sediment metagenome]